VIALLETLVSVFVTVIVTPGSSALLGSVTIPPNWALPCDRAIADNIKHMTDDASAYLFAMTSSPLRDRKSSELFVRLNYQPWLLLRNIPAEILLSTAEISRLTYCGVGFCPKCELSVDCCPLTVALGT
jgi:hypothetical protein